VNSEQKSLPRLALDTFKAEHPLRRDRVSHRVRGQALDRVAKSGRLRLSDGEIWRMLFCRSQRMDKTQATVSPIDFYRPRFRNPGLFYLRRGPFSWWLPSFDPHQTNKDEFPGRRVGPKFGVAPEAQGLTGDTGATGDAGQSLRTVPACLSPTAKDSLAFLFHSIFDFLQLKCHLQRDQ
jgi:hypothetical protein